MDFLSEALPASDFLLIPFGFVLTSLSTMWLSSATLQALKSKKVSFQSLYTAFDWSLFGQFMLASLLVGVGTFLGLLLFIVPGIVFSISTLFFMFVLVHERLGALDAIKRSFQLMKGHRMKVFLGLFAFTILLFIGSGVWVILTGHFDIPPTMYRLAKIPVQILFCLLSPLALLMTGYFYLQLHRTQGRKRAL